MVTSQMTFSEFCPVIRRKGVPAFWLLLCTLGLGVSAGAQEAALNPKKVVAHKLLNPPHGADPAAGVMRLSANAQLPVPASNAKEVVLHNFVSPPHGAYPALGVIRDFEGNLYGTTNGAYSDIGGGGTNNAGVVFKIDTHDNQTVLHSFTGGADGANPKKVIFGSKGNLYGTTTGGGAAAGANGYGVVFKIDPSGNETVLYTFSGGNDGAYPNLNVTLDSHGNLYGTTNNGGTSGAGTSGYGVVFKFDPSGHETVLHNFTGGNDGAYPNGVIRDFKGNLYGAASGGGTSGSGVVYKIDPSGNEAVLYSFTGGNDGNGPSSGLVLDLFGNLYGTTAFGGSADLGVLFKLNAAGRETVLHTFTRGLYGHEPDAAGVILDEFGNLYGTTAFGAAGGAGAVYKSDASGKLTVVYAFPGVADGKYPYNNGVIFGSDGQLYGTTFYGGRSGPGVVYQLDGGGRETVLYSFDLFTANGFGQPTGGVTRDSAGNL